MSHHPLRKETNCLNCGQEVLGRYCGNCGQENIESRMSFLGLVTHFFEDLTHYEGKFWKTIKHLFFKPGALTLSFLEGKRNSSLPPVRLYIFVSFLTFFLAHILPTHNRYHENKNFTKEQLQHIDSMRYESSHNFHYSSTYGLVLSSEYKSRAHLDSARAALTGSENEISFMGYLTHIKAIELRSHMPDELWQMFLVTLGNNVPKTLFFYLPLFALVIGFFHRKQHVYFDHAIFTLHYFSFLLLTICLYLLLGNIAGWVIGAHDENETYLVKGIILFLIVKWIFVYFVMAHKLVYKEKWLLSISKSVLIFTLNLILFLVVFVCLLFLTIYMLH
jgi:hypothetical protein